MGKCVFNDKNHLDMAAFARSKNQIVLQEKKVQESKDKISKKQNLYEDGTSKVEKRIKTLENLNEKLEEEADACTEKAESSSGSKTLVLFSESNELRRKVKEKKREIGDLKEELNKKKEQLKEM